MLSEKSPLGATAKWFEKYGYAGWFFPSLMLVLVAALAGYLGFTPDLSRGFYTVGPVALVVFFSALVADEWMGYVIIKNFYETPYVLLEVKMPTEITQSPLAMETVLNAFYSTGEPATPKDKYLKGKLNPQYSLEIVSLEGEVHFYIYAQAAWRNVIEAQMYAHYPSIEISEVPDYVDRITFDRSKMNLWGVETTLLKPDPYPLKTYMDFGLTDEKKEEFKTDPLASIVEFFGTFGKGEYGFWQLIITSTDADTFQKEGKELIKKLVEEATQGGAPQDNGFTPFRIPTKDVQLTIESLSRNMVKKPFRAGLRMLYIADLEHYNSTRHGGLPTMMRSFEAHGANGFKPVFFTYKFKVSDPFGIKVEKNKRKLFDAYRWRSYITAPHTRPSYVLSAEEVATVWHLPGAVLHTPTLPRISSRRGEAPSNLPRG